MLQPSKLIIRINYNEYEVHRDLRLVPLAPPAFLCLPTGSLSALNSELPGTFNLNSDWAYRKVYGTINCKNIFVHSCFSEANSGMTTDCVKIGGTKPRFRPTCG